MGYLFTISYFGWTSIVIIAFCITLFLTHNHFPMIWALLNTLFVLQLAMTFPEFLSLWFWFKNYGILLVILLLAISGLMIINVYYHKTPKHKRLLTMLFILFTILGFFYSEFFNGVATFKNYDEFLYYRTVLKKEFKETPIKIIDFERGYGWVNPDGTDVFLYRGLPSFNPIPIKIVEEDKIYYYRINGYVEVGEWFQIGVPISEQI